MNYTFLFSETNMAYRMSDYTRLSNEEYIGKSAFQKKIDLTSLTKGIYLIKVSGESFLANQRVVLF